jgi:hypothetical protein
MQRSNQNLIIDITTFIAFVLVTTTGVLMKYLLPPGSGHHTTIWGMDRHEWGDIHFWMCVVLLGLLAVHLILHWKWIVCMIRGRPREESGARVAIGIVGLIALIAIAVSPIVSPVEIDESGYGKGKQAHESTSDEISIRGSMTLGEIEQQTGVPAAYIIQELGLPEDTPLDSQTGRLRRSYGIEMDDVRRVVREYLDK